MLFFFQGDHPTRDTILSNYVCDSEKVYSTYWVNTSVSYFYVTNVCGLNMSTWNETWTNIGYTEQDLNIIYEEVLDYNLKEKTFRYLSVLTVYVWPWFSSYLISKRQIHQTVYSWELRRHTQKISLFVFSRSILLSNSRINFF